MSKGNANCCTYRNNSFHPCHPLELDKEDSQVQRQLYVKSSIKEYFTSTMLHLGEAKNILTIHILANIFTLTYTAVKFEAS